jgi:hypothetical protein
MKAKPYSKLAIMALFLLILTSSCVQAGNDPIQNVDPQPSQSALTILNLNPIFTPTPDQVTFTPTATATLTITAEPLPSESIDTYESPTNTPNNPSQTCTNQAEFIKNLTVGNNTALNPGQHFAKIWQIKNVGSCTWTNEYNLIFTNGNDLHSPASVSIQGPVAPGETIDLRLNLVAPNEEGSHSGSWMLQDNMGNQFGIGQSGDQPLELTIIVKPTPAPTSGCVQCQVDDDKTP